MTEKLKKCPICRNEIQKFVDRYGKFAIRCNECNMYFGIKVENGVELEDGWIAKFDYIDDLIAAWNTRAEDENPPLTLDELQKMYRNPIWIQGSEQRFSGWAIVGATFDDYDKQVARCADGLNISYYMKDYGTWVAYKRKPEEEVKE